MTWLIALAGCASASHTPESPSRTRESTAVSQASGNSTSAPSPTDPPPASTPDEPQQRAANPPANPAPGAPMDEVMRVHFRDAELIREAVIAGRPQDTGKAAESLVHLFAMKELPKGWSESIERLQASARRVHDSSDIGGVAAATADLGVVCGECHQKHGGPTASRSSPPGSDGSLYQQMKRHAWAMDRLWEGLFIPSDAAWAAGATTLRNAPFPAEVLKKGGVYAKSAAAAFDKVTAVAETKRSPADRATAYAELLGTCASCHLAMK